jgi:20S proteasome alpha/beta subunit
MITLQLPKPAKKPYILSRKAGSRNMTIAVAVTHENGIFLFSDRLITHGSMFSHYERKMSCFLTGPSSSIAICGTTDDFEAMRSVTQKIEERFNPIKPDENPYLRDVLEEELANLYSRSTASMPTLELLVAQTSDRGLDADNRLYKTSGPHVTTANPFDCIGIGDTSLVRYVSESLYDREMPIQEAITLGIYLVQLARRYMPQYVGGETDIIDVCCGFCTDVDRGEIRAVEEKLDQVSAVSLKNMLRDSSTAIKKI